MIHMVCTLKMGVWNFLVLVELNFLFSQLMKFLSQLFEIQGYISQKKKKKDTFLKETVIT